MIHNDKMLTYFFWDSLENTRIKKWKDLVEAFLKQYKFNFEISPDKTSLMTMEKGNEESVKVYVKRWRVEATHV